MSNSDGFDPSNLEPNRQPPEDNPFVAFRRFADKQVAQLLNMVLASPTTPRARAEQLCLFGNADMAKCERIFKLCQMQKSTLWLLELCTAGDEEFYTEHAQKFEQYQKESAQLVMDICRDADQANFRDIRALGGNEESGQLIERIGHQKGQQVAGDWDWDIVKTPNTMPTQDSGTIWGREMYKPQRMFERVLDELGNNFASIVLRMMQPCGANLSPQYWPNALETDKHLSKAGISWRDAFEDLMRVEVGASLIPKHQLGESNRISYAQWLQRFWNPSFGRDYADEGSSMNNGGYPKKVPIHTEDSIDEPSYEYSHDHEDQHDDTVATRGNGGQTDDTPATELDAYEQLLGSSLSNTKGPSSSNSGILSNPSVLSTLTTTERRYASDGTMTESTVVTKRFSDGREETSETVRTQRGKTVRTRESQSTSLANLPPAEQQNKATGSSGSKGWFWS